mmetsp:Transcript_14119/g.30891  ORF Transcript_14119/g.30891 Transcript_14119/m.30891 type:complete len:81 (+) Transcript_14119:763-1005(+)
MMTIHVLPLCTGADNAKDNTIAKVLRSVENKVLYGEWFGGRMLRRRGTTPHKIWKGTPSLSTGEFTFLGEITENGVKKSI